MLQAFSLWLSRTQGSLRKLRAVILMAELLLLLEVMIHLEMDHFSSVHLPLLLTVAFSSVGLRGQDVSWVLKGVGESQDFHSLSLCFAWLSCREWGVTFQVFPIASCWPRKALEKQEEVFGLCLSPTSSLIPRKNHWVLQGKNVCCQWRRCNLPRAEGIVLYCWCSSDAENTTGITASLR